MIFGFTKQELKEMAALRKEDEIPRNLRVFVALMIKPLEDSDPEFSTRLSKRHLLAIVQSVVFELVELSADELVELSILRAMTLNEILKNGREK